MPWAQSQAEERSAIDARHSTGHTDTEIGPQSSTHASN